MPPAAVEAHTLTAFKPRHHQLSLALAPPSSSNANGLSSLVRPCRGWHFAFYYAEL
jgi:hypothetical protein